MQSGFCCSLLAARARLVCRQRSGDLAAIKQRGVINVGTQADYPPFEFIQDSKIVGYDKDLLDLVVASASTKSKPARPAFRGAYDRAVAEQIRYDDLHGFAHRRSRGDVLAMTLPIAVARVGFCKRKDDTKDNVHQ